MSESFVAKLDEIVAQRLATASTASYTRRLADQGVARVAQKVGEEAIETVIAGIHSPGPELLEEAADLVFHLIVLVRLSGYSWSDVETVLSERHRPDGAK